MPCSQTPGVSDTTAQNAMSDGVFWGIQPIDHPRSRFNGALSLQPEGLRPITSLSTLDPHRYPYRPKTRYQVRWVPASWAALSAASKTAPRGAQIRTYYDFVASCGELNPQRLTTFSATLRLLPLHNRYRIDPRGAVDVGIPELWLSGHLPGARLSTQLRHVLIDLPES